MFLKYSSLKPKIVTIQEQLFDICRHLFHVFVYHQQILEILVAHNVMLVPAGKTRGIFPVSLGLVKALNDKGMKAVLFTPFTFCGKSACTMNAVEAKVAFAPTRSV